MYEPLIYVMTILNFIMHFQRCVCVCAIRSFEPTEPSCSRLTRVNDSSMSYFMT